MKDKQILHCIYCNKSIKPSQRINGLCSSCEELYKKLRRIVKKYLGEPLTQCPRCEAKLKKEAGNFCKFCKIYVGILE